VSTTQKRGRDEMITGPPCEVQGCTAAVAYVVDGDQLCEAHYHEHWEGK
jgi:hypothetical protein